MKSSSFPLEDLVENENAKLAVWEAVCILFWLLLDGFWLLEWHLATYAASLVALAAAAMIFFYLERRFELYLMGAADILWLVMNILWITHDFYEIAWCRTASIISFFLATALFVWAYARSETIRSVILLRFRILHSLFKKTK